jgi:hypothetical protein
LNFKKFFFILLLLLQASQNKFKKNKMSNIVSGTAVLLSAISLAFSGFATYQLFEQQKKFGTIETTLNELKNSNTNSSFTSQQNLQQSNLGTANSNDITNSLPTELEQKPSDITSNNNVTIQPGQFVQFAFKDNAKVEILSFKRIQNPETQKRDVVNLQMRVRLVGECETGCNNYIRSSDTKARNPDTSETYEAVSRERSTGNINLFLLKPGSSVDAYVWMKIPEGVSNVDIFAPNTAAFKNVPITN